MKDGMTSKTDPYPGVYNCPYLLSAPPHATDCSRWARSPESLLAFNSFVTHYSSQFDTLIGKKSRFELKRQAWDFSVRNSVLHKRSLKSSKFSNVVQIKAYLCPKDSLQNLRDVWCSYF